MKRFLYFLISGLMFTTVAGCKKINGKGDTITETRTVGNYNSIGLSISGTVNFRQDSVYSLSVIAQENLFPYIETYVDDNTLVIKIKDHYTLGSHDPITINLTAPSVNDLDISGSGDINTSGPWTVSQASLNISGSGNFNIDTLATSSLKANISGSGIVNVAKGVASTATLVISGSGSIKTQYVMTNTVNATISGSGDIYCWTVDLLVATISGSGNIYYNGNPQVEAHISGSGTVRKL